MNLWGVAPLLVAALLGGSGAHVTAAHDTIQRGAAQSPRTGNSAQQKVSIQRTITASTAPSAVPPAASAPGSVLRQVGPTTWETTVLLNDTSPACSAAKAASYWLVTTSPNGKIGARKKSPPHITIVGTSSATATPRSATKKAGAAKPNSGSSCEVQLTFTKLGQTPQTATLVINQAGMSSSIALTVSRDVTLAFYLGYPAAAGAILAVLLFFLPVLFIKVYDWDGTMLRGWQCGWWVRPILGSGAWTINDSWATNISTGLVVVGTVLTATTAANSLFPGIALDRFAIVNIVAGAIVVIAPVVFGIYYALFTAWNPGPTADATVRLPSDAAVTIEVPSGASITMSGDTTVQSTAENLPPAKVRAGCTYQIPAGTRIDIQAGDQARVQGVLEAVVQQVGEAAVPRVAQEAARAAALAVAPKATQEEARAAGSAVAKAAQKAAREAVQAPAQAAVQDAVHAIAQAGVREAARAIAQEAARTVTQGNMRAGAQPFARIANREAASAFMPEIKYKRKVRRTIVRVVADAVVQEVARAAAQEVRKEAEKPVVRAKDAPASTDPRILAAVQAAEAMTFPGAADIGVRPGSILNIMAPGGPWTIQASDQVAPPPPTNRKKDPAPPRPPKLIPWWWPPAPPSTAPDDVRISYPARIDAHGGVKITLVGMADVNFPPGTVVTAPRRRKYTLRRERKLLAPQGTSVIAANMGMLVVAGIFTMFGIGAELGVAFILAYFSEATQPWRDIMFIAIAAIALLVIVYAKTATRTMADPQPGSSISAQAGTSFTL